MSIVENKTKLKLDKSEIITYFSHGYIRSETGSKRLTDFDLTKTISPVLHSTSPIKHLARYIKCLIADNTEGEYSVDLTDFIF